MTIKVDRLKPAETAPEERKARQKKSAVLLITRQTDMPDIGQTGVFSVSENSIHENLLLMRLTGRHQTRGPVCDIG